MNNTFQKLSVILIAVLFSTNGMLFSQTINESWAKENYIKSEVMIPMRDGIRLFTAIYKPKRPTGNSPILIMRTPYKASPYGKGMSSLLWNEWEQYARENYILVLQDVRGCWKSEGDYVNIRPFIASKKEKKEIDEASDAYDTVDWLLQHVEDNNGKVGFVGTSYPGFYALMAGLSGHPAIKAISPQAPVTDWFMGDDYHHNGALMLDFAFSFSSSFGRPRPKPTESRTPNSVYWQADEYSFFLRTGALKNFSSLLGDSIHFWNDIIEHPNYDTWWKARDSRRACYHIKPAVLIVGGLFDAEDCYGAWEVYKAIRKQSPETDLYLAEGPWYHGQWNTKEGYYLGNVRFGTNTSLYYQQQIEFPFFQYYLKDTGNGIPTSQRASIFFSGENKWKKYESWPPQNTLPIAYYLTEGGGLTTKLPTHKTSYSEYISDPAKPVPHTDKTQHYHTKEYMTDDQRFAERRPDVLSFKTVSLKNDITIAGPVTAELEVALSTTDADFIVKVIDEFPEQFNYNDAVDGKGSGNYYLMQGYQMLVRGEVMRGRFRNGFEHPEAFIPNQPTLVRFQLPDIAHTFRKGHRINIQIQSSWFPLVERNPQQFVNINNCDNKDFIKSTIRLFHQQDIASKVIFQIKK